MIKIQSPGQSYAPWSGTAVQSGCKFETDRAGAGGGFPWIRMVSVAAAKRFPRKTRGGLADGTWRRRLDFDETTGSAIFF